MSGKLVLMLSNGGEGLIHVGGSCLGLYTLYKTNNKDWRLAAPLTIDFFFGITSIITALYLHFN